MKCSACARNRRPRVLRMTRNCKVDRDRAVESLLRTRRTRTPEDCLEPETLAAWVDGGLSDQEIALAEAHVADCSSCQALVAAMAESPQPASAAVPWWRRAWGFPILVPLTAGA